MPDGRVKSGTASAIGGAREDDDSRAALEASFRKYFRELVGMLKKRVKDPETAADIAQTAFARLAGRMDEPAVLDQFRAFQSLREQGLGDDEIAARFFVTPGARCASASSSPPSRPSCSTSMPRTA